MRQRRNSEIVSPTAYDSNKKFTSKNPQIKNSPPALYKIFIFCLITRIINSLLVQTYFNPDEHWQAPEVAHRIAFGYGHLTWEWKKGIRSYLHPVLFAALYKVLAFFYLDLSWFMIRAPRLLQSVFSAIGDLYLYKFSKVLFGDNVAIWALFAQLTNWFMFFCITRTLSNSLEAVITIVSLYYWPCLRSSSTTGSRKWALALAASACAVRPTSAITWIYIGLLELFTAHDKLMFVLLEVVPIGGLVLGLTFILDRQFYGSWVIVPLNFLKFNFLSSGGDYYGTHAWHWYITQGFTVMLFTYIPFSIAGILMSKEKKLSGLIIWVLGVYSLLGHKEFRFVLPMLPIALMFSGYSLANLQKCEVSKRKVRETSSSWTKSFSMLRMAVFFLLVTNIPMALYMSMVHQRGAEDVMNYLSEEAKENKVQNILFLTPCHATPYYSTLHQNIPMRFLDCTPSNEKGILDESDRFLKDPFGFVTTLARNWTLPSHIVIFDSQEKLLKEFLVSHNFFEVEYFIFIYHSLVIDLDDEVNLYNLQIKRFFHAHFKVDRELQASIVVYAYQGQ
ncbi:GPI mannosyltransferase 3 [Phtheirospermum japonicum]|uniref:Mannosyltransferase n=1 Tax=Phtheirospermum japonicum TaxID=374723 RepID=A0A830BEC6_9LAMI|nr:GPI mannosyltransferase 3 [Phtheirospermum japonicum]